MLFEFFKNLFAKKSRPASDRSARQVTKTTPPGRSAKSAKVAAGADKSADRQAKARSSPPQRRQAEATEEQIQEILSFQGQVLTAPGGPIEATQQQRQVIAILEDGTVVAMKGDALNPHVVEMKTLARVQGIPLRREVLVDIDVIRKVYENAERRDGGASRGGDIAKMQRAVVDLVRDAAVAQASDIHIVVQRFEAVIRFRVDGVMKTQGMMPSALAHQLLAAAFNMSDAVDPTYRENDFQGARISELTAPLPKGVQAVRLQYAPLSNGGRCLVVRLLYAESQATGADIDTLGYSAEHIEQIKQMRRTPKGIIVIAGPTGSGKSTTLQKALSAMLVEKRFRVSCITIEDPVEFVITGAVQYSITNAKTEEERTEKFNDAIRSALRSDPDVVLIGEIRDGASASLAFAAAMTGHQVWCSLHANDAISILDRLRDLKVELYKLSDHTLVTGLIGQRLIGRICPHCRIPMAEVVAATKKGTPVETVENGKVVRRVPVVDPGVIQTLEEQIGPDQFDRIYFMNDCGCEHCSEGYVGRTVIAETIQPDPQFMEHFKNGSKAEAIRHWIENRGGITMLEHAVQKMLQGIVDPRDVEEKADLLSRFDPQRRGRIFPPRA